jgi:glycosyltransferase involved in cell wall biosynthesis
MLNDAVIPDKASVAVIILTFNEECHIARAINSVRSFAKEIFVIDSGSKDRTVQISQDLGAVVFENKFVNQAQQFEWALNNAPISSSWIMRLDADEIIEPDLVDTIERELPKLSGDIVGINLKRKHIFMGRWIRWGGRYPIVLLRIWRRGHGYIEKRWMDEHITVEGGRTVVFEGGFSDENLNDLRSFVEKHNKYATREAIEVLNQRRSLWASRSVLTVRTASFKSAVVRFAKERIYNRIPFQISALSYFLYRYFLRLGFLDGTEGLIYHVLQGFWYRFLVGARVFELEQQINPDDSIESQKAQLARITGLDVSA